MQQQHKEKVKEQIMRAMAAEEERTGKKRTRSELEKMTEEQWKEEASRAQKDYEDQVRRDFFTTRNCRDRRVYLIRVPSRDRLCDSKLCVFLSDALGQALKCNQTAKDGNGNESARRGGDTGATPAARRRRGR